MRRLAVIAFVLTLAGCGGGAGTDLITKVQEATVKACGFMPVATTVGAILDTLGVTGGAGAMVSTAASQICNAVKKPAVHALGAFGDNPAGPVAEVNGVAVRGYFVKPGQVPDE